MPNRILKESICVSDTVDRLDWFEEVMFYRLIVNCDDFGRFDGRVAVIKGRLFPLKTSLTTATVQKALDKLATVGLVALYECEGRPILQLSTWSKHQQVRAQKSKYPAFDSSCMQMISDDIKCPRNPIQSESESNPNAKARSAAPKPAPPETGFAEFWTAYPKKAAKQAAQKAYEKLCPDEALQAILLGALERQKNSDQWVRDNGAYIPNPATWLNGRRWEDELAPKQPPKDGSVSGSGASFDAQELQNRILADFLSTPLPGEDMP